VTSPTLPPTPATVPTPTSAAPATPPRIPATPARTPAAPASVDIATALGAMTTAAPHLRWRIDAPGSTLGPDELSCAELAADPDAVAAAVAATADGRGSNDPQVLASLWWQAYAYRVAGTALACWLLTGAAPDVRAERMAVGVARSRPSSVVYLAAAPAPAGAPRSPGTSGAGTGTAGRADADAGAGAGAGAASTAGSDGRAGDPGGHTDRADAVLDGFVDRLFAGHLDLVAANLRARHPLGRPLVWGNVAAACASGVGAVHAAAGPGWPDRLARFLGAAPHGLDGLGTWAFPAGGLDFRRRTCCLWWKTTVADGALCADCSLRSRPSPAPTHGSTAPS
jgi:hypothetical protein